MMGAGGCGWTERCRSGSFLGMTVPVFERCTRRGAPAYVRWRKYECKGGKKHAGFRPRTTRFFCFGKRTQNHWRPGVALRVPVPRSLLCGLRNSLRSDSPRPHIAFARPGRSHARRRHDVAAYDAAAFLSWSVMPGSIGHPVSLLFRSL